MCYRGPVDTITLPSVPILLQSPDPISVTWNVVAVPGAFKGHTAGPFKLDLPTFTAMVANFRNDPLGRIRVDINHLSETLEGHPLDAAFAPAWITDLRVDGDRLLGRFEWNDQRTVELVRGGKLRYLSPAVRFHSKDPVTGEERGPRLSSVALTNDPFLRDIPAINATSRLADPIDADIVPSVAMSDTSGVPTMEVKPDEKAEAAKSFVHKVGALLSVGANASADAMYDALTVVLNDHKALVKRDTERLDADAVACVAERVAGGVIPDTDAAKTAAKALCLSDRASFDAVFPSVPKPKQAVHGITARDAALLSGRVLSPGARQPVASGDTQEDYREQLYALSETLADKIRATEPKLDEVTIQMRASSEAKRQLAQGAVAQMRR